MSRIACLISVSVVLVETLFSQQTPNLITFDRLLANPQSYLGQTIALQGTVNKFEPLSGFELIEVQKSADNGKAQPSTLQATWMKDATKVSLQKGQEVVVIGQIQIRDKTPIFHLANIITDKDAIGRFIRPAERRPRPGDNLGRDAQPTGSISD